MKRKDYEKQIQDIIQERKKKIVVKSVIKIVSKFLKLPIYDIFFGTEDNIEKEKHKEEQEIIIDLLCDMQDAISKANKKIIKSPKYSVSLLGKLKVIGKQADSITGVEIRDSAKNVEFKPGTNIQVKGDNVRKITGIKIGKDNNSSKEELKWIKLMFLLEPIVLNVMLQLA